MFTDEDFIKLKQRVAAGKEWVWNQPNNWSSKDPFVVKGIKRWFMLSEQYLKEAMRRGDAKQVVAKHSAIWHEVKFQEALQKWQKTPKIKRGPDPRTFARESFT